MNQLTIEDLLQTAFRQHQAGNWEQAARGYREILRRDPANLDALHLLGVAAYESGRHGLAVKLISRAIQIKSTFAEAHNNLGNALMGMGKVDESVTAYARAVELAADYADAHANLGNALKDQGKLDEAAAALTRAIELSPNHPEAHNNYGNVLREQGRLDAAIAEYRKAIRLNPGFVSAYSNLLLTLHYHPDSDSRSIYQEHQRWAERYADPLKYRIRPHANDRDPARRLRVGYVSSDFFNHACALFLCPLFEHHDRSHFEFIGYANVARPDAITDRLKRACDGWHSTFEHSEEGLADRIRQDRIDILVDLKLHTDSNRLLVFARKPAPIQVTWLGCPSTTGITAINYRFTDSFLDPATADPAPYAETSVSLPGCYWCYEPLEGREVAVKPLPALSAGRVTFGCFNQFCKITEPTLAMWASVLAAVPDSRLMIPAFPGRHRDRMLTRLNRYEVNPARIEFVNRRSRRDYLELYWQIDISLDAVPYPGHTTTFDSLWMGVPVVSLAGRTAVSRGGMSILSHLGRPEWIAHDERGYVQIARGLAADVQQLSQLRTTLRGQMEQSPLMDGPRFTRGVEAAYRSMWQQWCATAGVQ